eukprot:3262603-Rhodomonas_salina.2
MCPSSPRTTLPGTHAAVAQGTQMKLVFAPKTLIPQASSSSASAWSCSVAAPSPSFERAHS